MGRSSACTRGSGTMQVVVTSVGEAGASLVYPVSKDTEVLEPGDFVVGS